jgi:predicted regulator of Ras-like GTPase activity (Roadblock/LC7/MglB family)
VTTVSDPKLTPELALAYLGELSTDIRAAAVLDDGGTIAAQSGFDEGDEDQVKTAVADLFDHAKEAAGDDPAPDQVEVTLPEGSVFALREHGWTLAVVAGRFALSSLMFFDLRMVIRDLAGLPEGATS